MANNFTVRVEFYDSTAYDKIDQVLSLVASFNQQTHLKIDWSASFPQDAKIISLQFQGADAESTRNCAQFVCETINEGNERPLTYVYPEGKCQVTLH